MIPDHVTTARRKKLAWPHNITLWCYGAVPSGAELERIQRDAGDFLFTWSKAAAALGWSEENAVGLIWSLQGRRIVSLTSERAVLRSADGSISFYRRAIMARPVRSRRKRIT